MQRQGRAVGQDPWLLWGSTQPVQIVGTGGIPPEQVVQVVQVEYHHPTEWGFWLQCDLHTSAPVLLSGILIDYRFQIGVGRSNAIGVWTQFNFEPTDFDAGGNASRFTSQIQVLPPSASSPTNPSQPVFVDKFPAQSIQIAAIVKAGNQGAGHVTAINCTAFVAPRTHIRPEWFAGHFGTELGGR